GWTTSSGGPRLTDGAAAGFGADGIRLAAGVFVSGMSSGGPRLTGGRATGCGAGGVGRAAGFLVSEISSCPPGPTGVGDAVLAGAAGADAGRTVVSPAFFASGGLAALAALLLSVRAPLSANSGEPCFGW